MKWAAALAVAALAGTLGAQTVDLDEQRWAWRHRRAVTLPEGARFAALVIPPELAATSRRDLSDLRLVAADGTEVPYVVDRLVERERRRSAPGTLIDTRREAVGPPDEGRGRSVWIVDLGEAVRFDVVTLSVPSRDFAKRFRLEASGDRQEWRLLRGDAPVFDAPWSARVHHTTIELGQTETARYLRLSTPDDRRSAPIELAGLQVAETRRREGEEWRLPAALESRGPGTEGSRYRLDLPAGFPLEELRLEADDPAFARRVRVLEADGRNERLLGEGLLYRVRLADAALGGESLSLPLSQPPGTGTLLVEVQDGDSPPLRRPRAVAVATVARLLFTPPVGPVTLYHGNNVTRAPLYDLAPLRDRLALSGELVSATLGPAVENPRYRKPAPLPFTAARGAAVETGRWRSTRRLAIAEREDLWSVTLDPVDLAVVRPDLADLRIVDEDGRQVPYTLEGAAAEGRLPLAVEKAASRGEQPTTTRYRLLVRDPASGRALTLPLAALELDVKEEFFDRPARLFAPGASGARHERPVYSGRLARRVDPEPIVIRLDGLRASELTLDVDEGDNAPLTLRSVQALVRVPRLTFKAAPGAYRLLLGNRDAPPPRYDLASLREEVLSYSSVGVTAATLEPNPAYRRFAGDYFSDAPPTLLLWGTLLAAVAVLVLITARVLRQPPSS